MRHIAVVGASLAGVQVVEKLRNLGFAGHISLIGDEDHLPYDRPPLSKGILTGSVDESALRFHDHEWFAAHEIDLRLGERALRLDIHEKSIHTTAGVIRYDDVVIATGARARNPFPEAPTGVYTLRSLDDAQTLRTALTAARHLVVVGGGFIGLEVASSARALGKEVTVVEVADTLLARSLGSDIAPHIGELAEAHSVRLRVGRSVSGVRGSNHVEAVILDNGERVDCDLVLAGIGAVPNTEWLAASDLRITRAGLICNQHGRAANHVWGVGDVCAWTDPAGIPHRHEHWTSAADQARVVAHNMLNEDERTITTASYVWSDQFGHRINLIGTTNDHDAIRVLGNQVSDISALYARDGILVGACVMNQPRLMLQCRKWIADRTPITSIPQWDISYV